MPNIFEMQILTKTVIRNPHEHVYQGKKNNDVKTPNIEKKLRNEEQMPTMTALGHSIGGSAFYKTELFVE